MPRIYASNNDPYDFCKRHFPSLGAATRLYGSIGDGPDDRGNCFEYDAEHPPYEDTDYVCYVGERTSKEHELTEEDN